MVGKSSHGLTADLKMFADASRRFVSQFSQGPIGLNGIKTPNKEASPTVVTSIDDVSLFSFSSSLDAFYDKHRYVVDRRIRQMRWHLGRRRIYDVEGPSSCTRPASTSRRNCATNKGKKARRRPKESPNRAKRHRKCKSRKGFVAMPFVAGNSYVRTA